MLILNQKIKFELCDENNYKYDFTSEYNMKSQFSAIIGEGLLNQKVILKNRN